jgi:NAD(P)-dependent dehydrogenase (short-subunit alcohol dehydrogenase family)
MSPSGKDRNQRFQGRRAYITGAASGIGLATARLLAQGGAKLALIDRDEKGLQAAAKETGGVPFTVDLTDGAAIDRSVAAAAEALGGLDCVLNIAAISDGRSIAELEPDQWDLVMAVNITAPYRICRAALPFLQAQEGSSIVNIASGEGLLPSAAGTVVYSASKGGLLAFTRALAANLAPKVRVNAVCPGLTDTPGMAPYLHGNDSTMAQAFANRYALKRAADPSEIAEAIAFLASSEASYITGITLAADGGRTYH